MLHINKILDKIQNVVEYILVLPFLQAAFVLPFSPPLGTKGFVVVIFGGRIALFIYAAWFLFMGLGLVYSKIFKKRKWHRNFLLAIYLTTVYTSVLTFYIAGWTQIIDDVIIGAIAAVFWMRWKFRTEYINPKQFHSEVRRLKDDDPPPLP